MDPGGLWIDQIRSAIQAVPRRAARSATSCNTSTFARVATRCSAVRAINGRPLTSGCLSLTARIFDVSGAKRADSNGSSKAVRLAVNEVVAAVVAEDLAAEPAVVAAPEEREGRAALEANLQATNGERYRCSISISRTVAYLAQVVGHPVLVATGSQRRLALFDWRRCANVPSGPLITFHNG